MRGFLGKLALISIAFGAAAPAMAQECASPWTVKSLSSDFYSKSISQPALPKQSVGTDLVVTFTNGYTSGVTPNQAIVIQTAILSGKPVCVDYTSVRESMERSRIYTKAQLDRAIPANEIIIQNVTIGVN